MSLTNFSLLLVVVDWFILLAFSQTDHPITVGQLGSFYDPPTLSAQLNDTVTFLFLGPFHTVTQSTAANPCLPMPDGFDSGVAGVGTNGNSPESWTIRITNASEPIWFFCQITTPTSHCGSGMVGVINPPSEQAYAQFRMQAESVSGTPAPSPTLVLTGIGAVATTGPTTVPPSAITAATTTATDTDTVTSTPSPTATPPPATPAAQPSSTKTHLGAILGGAVGGVFALVLILAALIYIRRMRTPRLTSPVSDDSHFFDYTPAPVRARRPSEAFVAAKALEKSTVTAFPLPRPLPPPQPPHQQQQQQQQQQPRAPEPQRPLSPNRRESTPPSGARTLEHQTSVPGSLGGASAALSGEGGTGVSGMNMQALAHEVAAVLLRSPSGGTLNAGAYQAAAPGLRVDTPSRGVGTGHDPPAYRVAPPGGLASGDVGTKR